MKRPTILLHCCCAPCATHPILHLQDEYDVSLFFFNPNIHPEREYLARKKEIIHLANKWSYDLKIGPYRVKTWFKKVQGHEEEPEGSERCEICFHFRLNQTAQMARENGFNLFGTTLSISPHKNAKMINEIGQKLSQQYEIPYLNADFKKKNGFKISCEISREEGLYRQNYCGCIYSR